MSHHSSGIDRSLPTSEELRKFFADVAEREGFGATGEFPDGKLHENDEGAILFGVATHEDKIILNFGKPVALLAMTTEQALALSTIIRRQALGIVSSKSILREDG